LDSFFSSIGFISSVVDTNVYIHKESDNFIIIALYVNDIVLITNDAPHLFLKIKRALNKNFDMTDMSLSPIINLFFSFLGCGVGGKIL